MRERDREREREREGVREGEGRERERWREGGREGVLIIIMHNNTRVYFRILLQGGKCLAPKY